MHFSGYTNIKDTTFSVKKPIFSEPEAFSLVETARNEKSRSSIVSSTEGPTMKIRQFCNATKFQQGTTHESLITWYRTQPTIIPTPTHEDTEIIPPCSQQPSKLNSSSVSPAVSKICSVATLLSSQELSDTHPFLLLLPQIHLFDAPYS